MGELQDVRQIRGLGSEIARQYLWEALLVPPAGASPVGDAESMKLRCKTSNLPENANEPAEIMFKSSKIQYAGRDASGKSLDLTFFDTEDMQVYKTLYNWVDYTKEAPKSAYEGSLTLVLLNRGQDLAILTMTLAGTYPENLAQVSLDYGASEAVEISVTMRYDYITVA